jgi:hypothetical protein
VVIWGENKVEYFLQQGWTAKSVICPSSANQRSPDQLASLKVVSLVALTWIWSACGLRRLADILSVHRYYGFVPMSDIKMKEAAVEAALPQLFFNLAD